MAIKFKDTKLGIALGAGKSKKADTKVKAASKVLSFKETFAAERKKQGPNGTFMWKGKSYTTQYKEEVKKKEPKKEPTPSSQKVPETKPRRFSKKDNTYSMPNPAPKTEAQKQAEMYADRKAMAEANKKPDNKNNPNYAGGRSSEKGGGNPENMKKFTKEQWKKMSPEQRRMKATAQCLSYLV
jgi:hypothetical protein